MRAVLVGAAFVVTTGSLTGCAKMFVAPPTFANEAVPVNASFGRTWDAVIDYFASNNVAISTIERSSGLIVAKPARLGLNEREFKALAICGRSGTAEFGPEAATYNIVVRGDSSRATVRPTVQYVQTLRGQVSLPCYSTGAFERALSESVKARAERPR